jgi:hypothetical protein
VGRGGQKQGHESDGLFAGGAVIAERTWHDILVRLEDLSRRRNRTEGESSTLSDEDSS